jgi:hypothetical protein
MLRGLVFLLLLANALFFAWTSGWLAPILPGPQAGEREPERLARQVRPERITVLSPKAAALAASAAREASSAASADGPAVAADATGAAAASAASASVAGTR